MATLTVGTGQQYGTIAAAVAASADGDTVLVQAGTYTNDFFDVTHKITLQSVGGLAIIAATEAASNGKGAVVVDNDVTIDGFGFTGVTVADGNGAGIRYDSGQMTVKNSVFWNNQNGILANADPNGNIVIQDSEFSHNGAGDGYTHNIYINAVASLTVTGSYFHDSVVGHEIKSRALVTTITDNRIQDLSGTGSYSIDLPDGGVATITGNTIEKGANSENWFSIHYGGEGTPYANSSLAITGNTLVNDNPSGVLLLNQTSTTATLAGNSIYGYPADRIANGPVSASGNTVLSTEPALNLSTMVPATLTTTGADGTTTTTTVTTAPTPVVDLSLGTVLTSFGQAGAVAASGRILLVGPNSGFHSLASALAASRDGDTIELTAGTYVNDFGTVNHKVIIEGVGGIARIVQQNDLSQQAGLLVVNNDVTLKNLELTGTATSNGHAAGLAINAGNVTVVNSLIDNNEVGIYAADNAATTLSIYNSEIGPNGNINRGTNNLQIGAIESLTMVGDYVHGATSGHEIVDRAFNTDIENTRVIDGADVASSFLLDLGAGGNAILKNDLLVKGAAAANGVLVHVGGEAATYGNSNVSITGTTLVSQYTNQGHPYTYFVVADSAKGAVPVDASSDTFIGGVAGSQWLTGATGSNDTSATSAAIDTSSPVSAARAPTAAAPSYGPETLTLRLSGTADAENPQFTVAIDGTILGGGQVTAATGSAGQVFSFNGDWSLGKHTVSVTFLNPHQNNGVGAFELNVQNVTLGSFSVSPYLALTDSTPTATAVSNYLIAPSFDAATYLADNPDVAAAGVDPATHYLTQGFLEGRNPSNYFDTNLYFKFHSDVHASGANPLVQYDQTGWTLGADPSLMFSSSKYLAANPDVAAAHMDPLLHYIEYGQAEGRASFLAGGSMDANFLIDTAYVDHQLGASIIPTGTAGAQQAAWIYDTAGWQNGLNPNVWFDTNYYLSHNPDVAAAHIDPLLHYETYGWREGRDPSAQFSTDKYLAANPDVKAAGVDPLIHYIYNGQSEGRAAFAV